MSSSTNSTIAAARRDSSPSMSASASNDVSLVSAAADASALPSSQGMSPSPLTVPAASSVLRKSAPVVGQSPGETVREGRGGEIQRRQERTMGKTGGGGEEEKATVAKQVGEKAGEEREGREERKGKTERKRETKRTTGGENANNRKKVEEAGDEEELLSKSSFITTHAVISTPRVSLFDGIASDEEGMEEG